MSNNSDDRLIEGLVRRSFVPKGFRPTTEADEDAMLDAMGDVELSSTKLDRVLGKIRGEIPFGIDAPRETPPSTPSTTSEEVELAAMFRGEGEDIPQELADRLKELEEDAATEPIDDEDQDEECENG